MRRVHLFGSSLCAIAFCVFTALAVITWPTTARADDQGFCLTNCLAQNGGWPPGPGNFCSVAPPWIWDCSTGFNCNLCTCIQDANTRQWLCE